jgi:triosephosphate isomerase
MNKSPNEAGVFAKELAAKLNTDVDVVFCVPSAAILRVQEALTGTWVEVGAQNVHEKDSGAYTGEISAAMLKDMGVKYTIVGHSERREYYNDTDETVNLKTRKALENGIIPIVCVGEKLAQRDYGVTIDLVRLQTKIALFGVSAEDAEKTVIAYEPIWAIGTGRTATSEQAQEVCAAIRGVLREIYNAETAEKIRILYGGSVTADNAASLFAQADIDGGLVGGASLKMDFEQVVNG